MREEQLDVVWHGVMAGVVGFAVTAVGVGAADLLQGRNFFFTVALLGEWLFYGLKDPTQLRVWPGAVFAYNGVHLVSFVAFGVLSSWLAHKSEGGPLFWYAGLVLYLFVFVHMFATVVLMTEPMRAVVPMWQITVPSIVAVILMSWYLLALHPSLRRQMGSWVDDTDAAAAHR